MMTSYTLIILLLISFSDFRSSAQQQNDTACILDFSEYPYQLAGECINSKGTDVTVWDYVQTTRCCRNPLNTLSQALALWSSKNKDIFIEEAPWQDCAKNYYLQEGISIDSCGYDNLHQGNGKCGDLSITSFQTHYKDQYISALESCSQFDKLKFGDQCNNCSSAMSRLIASVLEDLNPPGNEKEICSIAAVIAVASDGITNVTWVDGFYGCLPSMDTVDKDYIKIKKSVAKALFATILAAMGLILLAVLTKIVLKKTDDKQKKGTTTNTWSGLYTFSKAEIEKAINYGNSKIFLGSGSAGRVYQGVLPSGQLVAVKQIYKSAMSGSFTREVERLSKIRHQSLVTLFGCCVEEDEQYLVYEFCPKGNLAQNLLRSDSILPWDKRVYILRDCALALRFLHTHPDGCIVHRDIKLTNILLTEDWGPKLSDFGLAKMIGMEESRVFTDVRGTIGYMDPEYMSNAKLSCSSDIYSFGIVALQLLSGRKVIELDIEARDTLTKKARDCAIGKRPLKDFVDPRLRGDLNLRDFEALLHVAFLCVANSSKGRPTIHDVVEELNKAWASTQSDMVTRAMKEAHMPSNSHSQQIDVIEV